jgi:prevent-host-death family protein
MEDVETVDVEKRWLELLARVEAGEGIVITRNGRAVAKLEPVSTEFIRDRAREAAQRIRERAKEMNLGPFDWEEWKRYRDEGRE